MKFLIMGWCRRFPKGKPQILQLLARGTSNKEIARLTNAAEATIKVHLKAILRKTNSQNRTQAAIWAVEHGFRENFLNRHASVVADTPTLLPAATRTTDHHSPNGKGPLNFVAGDETAS
jgi:hypothetical protein